MADIFTEALHKANINAGIISSQMGFDETAEVLEKGKRASVGEIRDWRGGKFQKTTDGWKPVPQRHGKASLKETEIENLKNGTITEKELNDLPDGTEIHIDSNGSYFRKDSEGWIYGNSVLDSENRTEAKRIVGFIETRMKSNGWDASKGDGRFGLKQVLVPGEEKKGSKNSFLDKDGKVTWDKSSAFTDENTWEGKLWHNVQRFQKLQDPSILSEIANTIKERFNSVLKTKRLLISTPILPTYGKVEFGWSNVLNFKSATIPDLQKLFDSFYKEYKEKNPEKKTYTLESINKMPIGTKISYTFKDGGVAAKATLTKTDDFGKMFGANWEDERGGKYQTLTDPQLEELLNDFSITDIEIKEKDSSKSTSGFDGVKEGDSIQLMGSTLNVIGRDSDNRLKLKDEKTGIEVLLDKQNWEKLGIKPKSVENPKEEKKVKEEKVVKKESLEDIGTLLKKAPIMSKEDLKKNFPNLTEIGGSYDGTLIVKNLRTLLKEKFPDVKFSVRKDGSNAWVTFPRETSDEVGSMIRRVADLFEISDYHPYEDYWGVKSNNFTNMFGGLHYIISQRGS